jgi:hypothetical protein
MKNELDIANAKEGTIRSDFINLMWLVVGIRK